VSATGAARSESASLERLDEQAAALGIVLEQDAPLGPLNTLRVGGPADRLVLARDRGELVAALRLAHGAGVPCFVLGNGSDLVIADAGVRGLVIRNRSRGASIEGTSLRAGSGAAMAMLVKRCVQEGLTGLEFGISIPGTLGGAVWANAGAHEGAMQQVVTRVEVWDPTTDGERSLSPDQCAFSYRESRFKHSAEVILEASLALSAGDSAEIARRVDKHQAQRRATQPLADQNAGSVFRNPPGDHAGRLIEAAGLKGYRIGTASVSTLHANFIVTDRGGLASDVRALGDHVRDAVAASFGVSLDYEIEFVGAWDEDSER